jgi:hypothetical protein
VFSVSIDQRAVLGNRRDWTKGMIRPVNGRHQMKRFEGRSRQKPQRPCLRLRERLHVTEVVRHGLEVPRRAWPDRHGVHVLDNSQAAGTQKSRHRHRDDPGRPSPGTRSARSAEHITGSASPGGQVDRDQGRGVGPADLPREDVLEAKSKDIPRGLATTSRRSRPRSKEAAAGRSGLRGAIRVCGSPNGLILPNPAGTA